MQAPPHQRQREAGRGQDLELGEEEEGGRVQRARRHQQEVVLNRVHRCWRSEEQRRAPRAASKQPGPPSLVTLRLVRCGPGKPAAEEEAAAVVLDDPSLSLGASGVTGTAWLLAFVAGSPGASCLCSCEVDAH